MNTSYNALKRRDFLKKSLSMGATAAFAVAGGHRLLGSMALTFSDGAVPEIKLNNGVTMPMLGFGTNTLHGQVCVRCVSEAISVGYRLIDTAHIYGNEEFVGEGIRQGGIDRLKLFVTSKLWVDDAGYDATKKALATSLDKLGLSYLDLYLIHRPRGDVKGSWQAMEELYHQGKIRAIGVSNFAPLQLQELMTYAKVKPAINQIETHVFFQQHAVQAFLKESDVQMQAWSPFAAGRNNIFSNPVLAAIAQKHHKSIAQVCLRWLCQRGIVTIPRSSQKAHMVENLDIFDFELDTDDLVAIATLDLDTTQFPEWE